MRRLLVIDDEPDVLDFVERVFRREYEVLRAGSVAEAEAQLQASAFDVIITDGRLPLGSGEALLVKARALQPGAVRVLLTGFSADERAGAEHVRLRKPIDAEALRHAVEEAARRRDAAAAATE